MYIDYINEAFKNLDLLTEDMFDASSDGISNLSRFMDDDDEMGEVRVIDQDASSEDDIQDSYIGKVLINCNVCHSHVFEDKENIVLDDEGFANKEEVCPYCGNQEGFTVVGEITEFNKDADTGSEDVETQDTMEIESDTPEIIEESLNESPRKYKPHTIRLLKLIGSDLVNDELTEGAGAAVGAAGGAAGGALTGASIGTAIAPGIGTAIGGAAGAALGGIAGGVRGNHIEKTVDAIKDKHSNNTEESIDESVGDIVDGLGKFNSTVGGVGAGAGIGAAIGTAIAPGVGTVIGGLGGAALGGMAGNSIGKALYDSLDADNTDSSDDASDDELLKEDFKEVSIKTEDQHLEMNSDENGKVTIVTEPITNSDLSGEMIAPVSPETEAEILANNSEEEEAAEPTDEISEPIEGEENFEEIDFDDIDEESMDELGESYLRRVYENVNSFKTTDVFSNDSSIIVEGMITFNSGASKKTRFMFESADVNSNGKLRFNGTNKHLTESNNAFSLVGRVSDKKLVVESLKYNYETSGTTVRGVVRRK